MKKIYKQMNNNNSFVFARFLTGKDCTSKINFSFFSMTVIISVSSKIVIVVMRGNNFVLEAETLLKTQ